MDQKYHAIDFAEKPKKYVLVEFPYPSGEGLHMGHAFSFTCGDVFARFQRMSGFNVLFPFGWDAFGLPTENYALRTGRLPQDVTRENTLRFHQQADRLGLSFDWEREVNTTDPAFYRWTQWIFIKLYEQGLAEKKEMPINWCPSCKVGLANEEVIDGHCERCGAQTTRRRINQWVVKITAYADKLVEGLKHTDFIEKVKTAQVNWIGKSVGARIRFALEGQDGCLEVFSTRPDTLWGATFLVVAPEHPLVSSLMSNPEIAAYSAKAAAKSDLERGEANEKDGVFSGHYALNPATGTRIPVWISDFVLLSYGSGGIMAVPAHDERDHAFARKFNLPIIPVVLPPGNWDFDCAAYTGMEGAMINSGMVNGLTPKTAILNVTTWLEENGLGSAAASYHLQDWIFSRQHYWGEPIPMVCCPACGWQPVPEEQLPVVLPEVEKYQPTDTGELPLANITGWVETTCPRCAGAARRETDTMPNWAGSDWYFLRYTDPYNRKAIASEEKMRYWLPVDIYIGGDEHNTLHLLYSRFIYLFLHDLGWVPQEIPEPYQKRLSHGVILGPDGLRMRKTRGNTVNPDEILNKYGADTVRMYLLFMCPFDATVAWNEQPIIGVKRFLDRLGVMVSENAGRHARTDDQTRRVMERLVRAVGDDIGQFKFNTAIAKQMEALNDITNHDFRIANKDLARLVQVAAPFAPFTAEDCWARLGENGSVHASRWPAYDPSLLLVQKVQIPIQVNGKLRGRVEVDPEADEASVVGLAREIPAVMHALADGNVKKVIYVKGRTLNFVLAG